MHNHGIGIMIQIILILLGLASFGGLMYGLFKESIAILAVNILLAPTFIVSFVLWEDDTIIAYPKPGCILYDKVSTSFDRTKFEDIDECKLSKSRMYFIASVSNDKICYYKLRKKSLVEEKLIDFLDKDNHNFIQIGYDKDLASYSKNIK